MGASSKPAPGHRQKIAAWRLMIIGPLLAAPPERGELAATLRDLAAIERPHPIDGRMVRCSVSTLERWYYAARTAQDPVAALQRQKRSDAGRSRAMPPALALALRSQHEIWPEWSWRLHHVNLKVSARRDPTLGRCPSYGTVRRWMQANGLTRQRRDGADRAEQRARRLYQSSHYGALWHIDCHHGSLRLPAADGTWAHPKLISVIDDRTRMVIHAEWNWQETAAVHVHILVQAFLKGGLPRAIMSDQGPGMRATEIVEGLERLGIQLELTRPYTPQSNGKLETWWSSIEDRLVPMLGDDIRTLKALNEVTQAWLNADYQRKFHSELGTSPLDCRLNAPDVSRSCDQADAVRSAFGQQQQRSVQRSVGVVRVGNVRFQVPDAFQHHRTLTVRFLSWDLSSIALVDPDTDAVITRLFPVDKTGNARGVRSRPAPAAQPARPRPMAPLLRDALETARKSGLPQPWIPFNDDTET